MKNKPAQRKYPRDVWVLSPAYIVKRVTVVARYVAYSGQDLGDVAADRKLYRLEVMHETKAAAIEYGRKQIEARRAYLAQQAGLLDTRAAKLDKAEAK